MPADRLTAAELQEIRERESKATPGPWEPYQQDAHGPYSLWRPKQDESGEYVGKNKDDADFIAASRTDVPRLIATVRHLAAVIHEAVLAYGQSSYVTDRQVKAMEALSQAEEEYHREQS